MARSQPIVCTVVSIGALRGDRRPLGNAAGLVDALVERLLHGPRDRRVDGGGGRDGRQPWRGRALVHRPLSLVLISLHR